MSKYKNSLYCIVVIALILSGCAPTLGQKEVAQCQRLIERQWGFGEDQLGYDSDQPSQSKYKLVTDDSENVLILDVYNNRISKYDSAGKFQVNIRPPETDILPPESHMQAEIKDVATTGGGRILAAISAPITVTSTLTKNLYFAIYEFDASGRFEYGRVDWRFNEDFRHRVLSSLGVYVLNNPFGYLIAGPNEDAYALWSFGPIVQYTPEGTSRVIYSGYWNAAISGWDGFVYVISDSLGRNRLLQYETLNGNLVKRTDLKDFPAAKNDPHFGVLEGVDANGKLYFAGIDPSNNQPYVDILSSDGQLERQIAIPGTLAGIDKTGQLYVFTFSKDSIPSGTFTVDRCDPWSK